MKKLNLFSLKVLKWICRKQLLPDGIQAILINTIVRAFLLFLFLFFLFYSHYVKYMESHNENTTIYEIWGKTAKKQRRAWSDHSEHNPQDLVSFILCEQLKLYLENIFGDIQWWFRLEKSTTDQIFALLYTFEKTLKYQIDTYHL